MTAYIEIVFNIPFVFMNIIVINVVHTNMANIFFKVVFLDLPNIIVPAIYRVMVVIRHAINALNISSMFSQLLFGGNCKKICTVTILKCYYTVGIIYIFNVF